MKRLLNPAVLAIIVAFATGCASPRQMTYLLDLDYNTPMDAPPAPELLIQAGDRLAISVASDNPQLAAPFNMIPGSEPDDAGSKPASYTVSPKGDISFPVLGTIAVAGMTTLQVRDKLAGLISALGYIREPIVNVALDNFTVTVLGSVNNGVINVDGPSINLLQVIARSGGTKANSNIKDVMVIRTENGQRTAYAVNLQTKDLYNSPAYYLHQNDVVYVKPKGTTLSPEGQVAMTFIGTGLTVTSFITNFLLWSSIR